ncbi:hypothetical protein RRG08_027144 [Elysia crispata]|uniref:Uncharacterized protein n=1 Tax=Elysia crispata TaxID=231223 RepID=A0AAE1D620_9GAST|nr:hypothetical protein RRG08_027144 [Elysia crispata]
MREGETKKNSEERLERLRFAPFPYDLNLTRSSIARANWLVTLGRFPSRCGSDGQAHLTAAKLLHDTTHPPHTHSSLLPSLSSSHFTTPSFIPSPSPPASSFHSSRRQVSRALTPSAATGGATMTLIGNNRVSYSLHQPSPVAR